MAQEPLTCGPEHVEFLNSTLYNYHLCKLTQDFLSKQGKLLCVSADSLQWDWSNGYGLNPYELVEDLLKKQFGATTQLINVIDEQESFANFFAKFPLGTVTEEHQLFVVKFPNKQFPRNYKFVEDGESDNYYFGMYEEEKKLHVACDESTIILAHGGPHEYCELNYAFILKNIFSILEGLETE